ncbi:MAG: hypothetical protein ACWGO1_12395 [Anaerolineales bacterium]
MLIYDENRTQQIVERLVATGNSLRLFTVSALVILIGASFAVLFTAIDRTLWWLGALLGIAFGAGLGLLAASFLAAILEWMAQVLIALDKMVTSK